MKEIPLKTKKQIVLSRIIYDYILNGLIDSLSTLSEEEMQVLIMRINMQAITHAIDISQEEEIKDFDYQFNQLGLTFNSIVPLSEIEFSSTFIDKHFNIVRTELGDDFEDMLNYLKKMQSRVI